MKSERRDVRAEVANVPSKGGKGKAFVIGGVLVVALVMALVVWGGLFGTWQGEDAEIEVSTQTEAPGVAVEPEPGVIAGEAAGDVVGSE